MCISGFGSNCKIAPMCTKSLLLEAVYQFSPLFIVRRGGRQFHLHRFGWVSCLQWGSYGIIECYAHLTYKGSVSKCAGSAHFQALHLFSLLCNSALILDWEFWKNRSHVHQNTNLGAVYQFSGLSVFPRREETYPHFGVFFFWLERWISCRATSVAMPV